MRPIDTRAQTSRVLVLATDAFGGHGGIAAFNRNLLTALTEHPRCEDVFCVCRQPPSASTQALPRNLKCATYPVDRKVAYALQAARASLAAPVSLIICGHMYLLPIAFMARLASRAPIALVMHGTDAWTPPPQRATRLLARHIDSFISVSEFTKRRFLQWSHVDPMRGFVLPNCVDLTRFTPGPPDTTLLERYGLIGKKVIMTLGRLEATERGKGIDAVLGVLPKLVERLPDLRYLIVGGGTDQQRLMAKAVQLGVANKTVFAGRIDESVKAAHYRLADAYVMPGHLEGFGIAYLEAMACGIPVLASTLDASREAVGNGAFGLVVNPEDPTELEAGILSALERPRGVVPEGLQQFSYPGFRARLHRIFDELSERQRA
jgi:phosphatidyl-myo-inositol dimannoside synthase